MSTTSAATRRPAEQEPTGALDRFFEISRRGSTIGGEIRGGLVTFVTMAYIVILNPIILSGKADIAGNELAFSAVGAATALTAGVMTILFGLVSRYYSRRSYHMNKARAEAEALKARLDKLEGAAKPAATPKAAAAKPTAKAAAKPAASRATIVFLNFFICVSFC